MQVIIVDNQKKQTIASRYRDSQLDVAAILIPSDNHRSAFEIATQINEIAKCEENIIFINANLNYVPGTHPWYGVEVIKEIRANGVFDQASKIRSSHIVFFAPFQPVQFININSETFFISISPRVTFVRYTEDPQKLNISKLSANKLTDLRVLLPYFKAHLLGSENRHSSTNTWAAGQFFRHYDVVKPGFSSPYLQSLNHTKTARLRDMNFVYELTHPPFSYAELQSMSKRLNTLRRLLWTEDRDGFRQRKKIALIDDQALRLHTQVSWGWQTIYSLLFFGDSEGVVNLDANQSDKDILSQIDYSYDCILLDLHFASNDHQVNARKIRGAVLMNKIQRRFPFLPVIITTASNKARKRKILQTMGCDAYWIKEGFDEPMNRVESFHNYLHLLELVTKVSAQTYRFLKQCNLRIQQLKQTELWWEHHRWPNEKGSDSSKIDKTEIINLLEHGLLLTRNYLQQKIFGEGFYPKEKNSMELRGLMVQLTLILELIHSRGNLFYTNLLHLHKDERGKELYRLRNRAAHRIHRKKIFYRDFCYFFEKLLDYLTFPVQESRPEDGAYATL